MNKVSPTAQEIKDLDTEVHNYLLSLVEDCMAVTTQETKLDLIAKILAVGLSAVHERIGDYWIWDKAAMS
jgi:hypothetical protein